MVPLPLSYINAGAHVSAWDNQNDAVNFFHKLQGLLLSRLGLSEKNVSLKSFSCRNTSSPFYDALDKYGFGPMELNFWDYYNEGYYTLACAMGDSDSVAYNALDCLLRFHLIGTFELSSSDAEFKEVVRWWEELSEEESDDAECSSEDAQYYLDHLEQINAARHAFNLCDEGRYEEALKDSTFKEIVAFFKNRYHIPADMVCHFLPRFISVFTDDEAYYMTYYVYASEELYLYNKYKDRLPADVRGRCEAFIECFLNPVCVEEVHNCCKAETFISESERSVYNVVPIYYASGDDDEYSAETDVKLFFPQAVEFVSTELPKLRKEYGSDV